jgi:cellulose biosynthesis protein BcsQ
MCDSIAGSKSGKRVCAVDFDHSQGNLTYAFGYTPWVLEHSVYTLMLGESTLEETLLHTYYDPKTGIFFDPRDAKKMERLGLESLDQAVRGPDLLPMNPIHCEGTEQSLIVKRGDWGLLLDKLLTSMEDDYDEFQIDTNPDTESIYPKIAIYAATHVEIPSTPENWSTQGWILYARFLVQARTNNPSFVIAGVVFSRYRYAGHKEVLETAKNEVIPAMNEVFTDVYNGHLQAGKPALAQRVANLHIELYDTVVSESKDYTLTTNRRSCVMTTPKKTKGEYGPMLEQWQCYIELLRKTEGLGLEQAVLTYNALIKEYQAARD